VSATARHWADWNEVTFVAGIRLLFGVHHHLGRWPFRLCLGPVILAYWLLHAPARRASRDYLERWNRVFGGPRLSSLRHFLHFGDVLLDKLRAVSGDFPQGEVMALGVEAVRPLLESGRGGVMITAHIGCLELCQAAAAWVPTLRLNVLVHTRHAERFNALLRQLQPQSTLRLLQVTEVDPATAADLAARVAGGEFVAIVGDRVPVGGGRTMTATFLGADADFPIGPWVLASLLRCPVFLLSCHRRQGERAYRLLLEPLAEVIELPRAARAQRLQGWVQTYADWLQRQLADAPYEWFNFFDFWSQRGKNPGN
jgi:predicted LPLAT superfamily acyltransferase